MNEQETIEAMIDNFGRAQGGDAAVMALINTLRGYLKAETQPTVVGAIDLLRETASYATISRYSMTAALAVEEETLEDPAAPLKEKPVTAVLWALRHTFRDEFSRAGASEALRRIAESAGDMVQALQG